MNGSPEQQIRRYIDEQGGSAKVAARHLLTSWQAEHFTSANRREIQQALARVELSTSPPLSVVGEDEEILLFVREPRPAGLVQRFRRWPTWAQVVVPIVALLLIVAALVPAEEESSKQDEAADTTEQPTGPTAAERKRARQADLRRERAERKLERAASLRRKRAAARRKRAAVRRRRERKAAVAARQEQERLQEEQRALEEEQQRQEREQEQEQEQCHPSYDPCLDPSSFDYDCQDGTGDGPDYTGPVTVTGDDPFDLDRDGNGTGCES